MKPLISILLALAVLPVAAAEGPPLLLQRPAVSKTHVAFVYGADLWIVGREGGDARRLTTGIGLETHPVFSPDGTQIAFAGEYEGNLDVYVVPSAGGVPRRLTYHPGPDVPVAWTPDGKAVVFRSVRNSNGRFTRLFTIPLEGGLPTELPLPMALEGSYSPDGKQIAYVPYSHQRPFPTGATAWKRYRGGLAAPVWIANLSDSAIVKVPREKSNDTNPMWIGDSVYFLSDRDGPTTLFAYDTGSKTVRRILENKGPDFKSASACADAIVYDQLGELNLFELNEAKARRLNIRVSGDLPAVRTRVEKVAKNIKKAELSPTGARALFEARCEILTVPAEKGDIRNLTNSTNVAERDPAWSPDGKTIAYFSDESGEYELHLRPQSGLGEVKKLKLGDAPSFYYAPIWSPDGKRIAYTDKRGNFWFIDLANGKSTKIDTNPYDNDSPPFDAPSWSPDNRWLAYVRQLKNYHFAVFLYNLDTGKAHQLTDGMSDARYPVFDKNGKHLFFLASTDAGPVITGSLSSLNRSLTRSAYLVALSKDAPDPLLPLSDEEKAEIAGKKKEEKDKVEAPKQDGVKVTIDLADIDQRILALPVPAKNYVGLQPAKAGSILLLEGPQVPAVDTNPLATGPPPVTVHRFDLEKRKTEKLAEGIANVAVSQNGEKLLYQQGQGWFVAATGGPVKPGDGALKMDGLEVRIDPLGEWQQMYRETWRIQRDFLYDPNFHGLDLKAAESRYARYLPGLASRFDLIYLFEEMLGELSLGHVYIYGGDVPVAKGPRAGLLGADYRIENDRYRIARIYRGENWNPQLRSPLTQPGASVKEGEYVLAVNGREVRGTDNIYAFFEGTAGKQTSLRVGPVADGAGARDVTVVPIAGQQPLRHLAWVDENRRKVDRLTGGRVAYVYVPDTWVEGYARFNRYFFAQAGKDGAIIDERFNGGGELADHIIDYLRQPLRNYASTREGEDQALPRGTIFGPKVMLINEQAGSGGDYLPYAFRQAKLGPLVGKRTWGGLVGIGGYPTLIDGGTVTAPRWGIWFPNGRWDVENRGVPPDVEVEFDPKAVRAGHDPQLEKAVELVMEELRKNPPKKVQRPPYPNYQKGLKEPAEGK